MVRRYPLELECSSLLVVTKNSHRTSLINDWPDRNGTIFCANPCSPGKASVDLFLTPFQVLSGTRGFEVTEGVLLSVNLFCDAGVVAGSSVWILDPSLTAVFAPS